MRRCDRRHFGQIFVKQRREFFRLHPLRARREVDHVREEDRQLLALGGDLDVLAGENAAIKLRRQIFGDFFRQGREELVGLSQLLVEARDQTRLMALQRDEGEAGDGDESEVNEQIFEREDVGPNGLADDELFDATHVANLPVVLGAIGVAVVATHAGGRHDDRRGQPDTAIENRA